MYTDTHCHVLSSYYKNINNIIKNLEKSNIKRIIINGFDFESNVEVIKLVNEYECVYGAIGIHPDNLDNEAEKTIKLIEENILNKKILAVGEIGLDYYHNSNNKNKQILYFNKLLKLAEKHQKPVIIHCREASSDVLDCIKKYNINGIIHCFTDTVEIAKKYINEGFKLGINGIVTFRNSSLPLVLEQIPIESILLETDCPYITPEPFRKMQNEPKFLNETAKKVASIYKIDEKELSIILEKNLNDTFDII